MAIRHLEEYRDPETARKIIDNLKKLSRKPVRIMEVCGTHTMSIFRNGIRSLLPDTIKLVSGPGCPVCVTPQRDIDAFISVAGTDNVIMTVFGDLMRVPGTRSSLKKEHARGRDIRVVYSPSDALRIARENPSKKVVFPGVGFETTAPLIGSTIMEASRLGLDNYYVFSAHKLVPPALSALVQSGDLGVDGFLLPGHVSVIIGMKGYGRFFEKYKIPCVAAGFEPADILHAIHMLIDQIEGNEARLENAYKRAVSFDGNKKALDIMNEVFETGDTHWRGLGTIPESGLVIRKAYGAFDAERSIDFDRTESGEPEGCACGDILKGIKIPSECPLFKKVCSPMNPIGPCMVSSEGTCSAYYRYGN